MNAVSLTQVAKRFGSHQAVDDLSFQVPAGSIYGFIGPNGSGKTTTLRMILRIIEADTGRIEVLQNSNAHANNDRVGYLPEERGLYKKMTVQKQLAYYASLKGVSRLQAKQDIDQWLKRMDLTDWQNHKIETLSKGMAQKVQFIAALINRPDLLILDEPFYGLDPVNLEVLRAAILDLHRQGTTILFSTHDMVTAERMCDYILMIFKGRKVLDGTLESIQKNYATDTIRLKIDGQRNILDHIDSIERIIDQGNYQEITFNGDPQILLKTLAEKTTVKHFEICRPSLHDIFLRIAGPDAEKDPENVQSP